MSRILRIGKDKLGSPPAEYHVECVYCFFLCCGRSTIHFNKNLPCMLGHLGLTCLPCKGLVRISHATFLKMCVHRVGKPT